MKTRESFNSRVERYSPEVFEKSALERQQIVYIPQYLCQSSLPSKLLDANEWVRSFNNKTYTVLSPSSVGVPGGHLSRLIIIQLNTLAKHSDSKKITLTKTPNEFMKKLGKRPRGGPRGGIEPFWDNFVRCLNCIVHSEEAKGKTIKYSVSATIDDALLSKSSSKIWKAEINTSSNFYNAAQVSVPTDWGALLCLSPSTLSMDIFNFLVYRLYYLKKETVIPWKQLQAMFSPPQSKLSNFKTRFKESLTEATIFYPSANTEVIKVGLKLKPSAMLIQPIK